VVVLLCLLVVVGILLWISQTLGRLWDWVHLQQLRICVSLSIKTILLSSILRAPLLLTTSLSPLTPPD
ncbi:unnamed protein product, partial [Brassica napus]